MLIFNRDRVVRANTIIFKPINLLEKYLLILMDWKSTIEMVYYSIKI